MELGSILIAGLTGLAMGVGAIRFLIRAEFDRFSERLDRRYAPKEETERRFGLLEDKVL